MGRCSSVCTSFDLLLLRLLLAFRFDILNLAVRTRVRVMSKLGVNITMCGCASYLIHAYRLRSKAC